MKFTKSWKRFWTMNRNHAGGFTLVELIVVIAILAILAGIAIPAYSGYINKAKEAGDYTLLSAINTAFAAACIENGQAAAGQGSVTITGYNDANPIAVSVYNDAFQIYLGDSANSDFEVIEGLFYDNATGVFSASSAAMSAAYNYVIGNMGTQIGAVKDSAFGSTIKPGDLMATVDGVTGLATEMLAAGEGNYLYDMMLGEGSTYVADLAASMDMTTDELLTVLAGKEDGGMEYLANSAVLNVAQTVNGDSYDKAAKQELLASGNLGAITSNIQTSGTGLADAALIYGLYTAYNPSAAGTITSVNDLSALANDKGGFVAYLETLSDPNSQASKDLAGYYAALDIVNGAVDNDPAIADQVFTNGYTDSELVGMMGSVLG